MKEAVDSRCYPELQRMMDDCRAQGLDPLICSSYRSEETQAQLYQEKMNSYLEDGYTQAFAASEAATTVARPEPENTRQVWL